MTLSSSLNAGVAGLNVNSSKLSTISDNIANTQTNGYKRSDTQFSSLVVSESGSARYTAGGVTSTSLREVDIRGGLITSSNPTDLAIGGRGLFPVTPLSSLDSSGSNTPVQFVSTGSFRTDENGALRTASGLTLLGWPADRNGEIGDFSRDTTSGLEPIRIETGSFFHTPTTEITLGVNLPADQSQAGQSGATIPLSVEYFDNLGAPQSLNFSFTPTIPASGASNEWTVAIDDSQTDPGLNPVASFTVLFDDSVELGGSIDSITGATGGAYDPATGFFTFNTASGPMDLDIGTIGASSGFTQVSTEFGPTGISKNGSSAGSLASISVDENGLVQGLFQSGAIQTLYQIPIADFANLNGLTAVDNQAFIASKDSGSLFLWDAGDGPTGTVIGFVQEASNADLATELTSLIETQRAYSSNATVIRTVDEMLQETTNIKR